MKTIKETCYKGTRILVGNEKRIIINKMYDYLIKKNYEEISIPIIQMQEIFANKIGKENMPQSLLDFIAKSTPTPRLLEIFKILESDYKLKKDVDFFFDPTLARGLDYYTSTVFEMKLNGMPQDLSVGGGGRYDNLIGMFAGRQIPAVGFSFGIDRIIELI